MAAAKIKAAFIEPILLIRSAQLPDGPEWLYALKLDGYRTLGIRTGGKVQIRSRNDNDFSVRYPAIARALAKLPDETVIDGEIIALDGDGRPSFNTWQIFFARSPVLILFQFSDKFRIDNLQP